MNEFFLAVVVVFSLLFLDLTVARADDVCPPAGTSYFAKGTAANYVYFKVTPATEGCVEIESKRVTLAGGKKSEKVRKTAVVICGTGGVYGTAPNDVYMHCMNGKAHHLQEEHAKPKVSYYSATYEELTKKP